MISNFVGAQNSYLTAGENQGITYTNSVMLQSNINKRAQTRSPTSRYKNMPTENLKFQKFIDLILNSKMEKNEIKIEI